MMVFLFNSTLSVPFLFGCSRSRGVGYTITYLGLLSLVFLSFRVQFSFRSCLGWFFLFFLINTSSVQYSAYITLHTYTHEHDLDDDESFNQPVHISSTEMHIFDTYTYT